MYHFANLPRLTTHTFPLPYCYLPVCGCLLFHKASRTESVGNAPPKKTDWKEQQGAMRTVGRGMS